MFDRFDRFKTTHPSQGFDIVIDYDTETLFIDTVQDADGKDVVLGDADTVAVLDRIATHLWGGNEKE